MAFAASADRPEEAAQRPPIPQEENRQHVSKHVAELAKRVTPLGRTVVDVSGELDQIRLQTETTANDIHTANDHAAEAKGAVSAVLSRAEETLDATRTARSSTRESTQKMVEAATITGDLANWATSVGGRAEELIKKVRRVEKTAQEIDKIASQVNILSVNASVEAARAGAAGPGFAVIAQSITELATTTQNTVNEIIGLLGDLGGEATALVTEGTEAKDKAEAATRGADAMSQAIGEVDEIIGQIETRSSGIVEDARGIDTAYDAVLKALDAIEQKALTSATAVGSASDQLTLLVDESEALVSLACAMGGTTQDSRFIDKVLEMAAAVSHAFEAGIAKGMITEAQLFDQRYTPIPGTNPEQVMAPFTNFTDKVLPPIQEAALDFDPKVMFCAAIDRNGYLPTHNNKFSKPQGNDPIWNAANCRNRRIFDDRVGLKSGRNTSPFLLQTYRRDMGDHFIIMKDLSAPIIVNNKHWGGLRFAFKF